MAHGGKRDKAGRKPKADEQKLIEKLTPLASYAFDALENGLKDGKDWAVKLWFAYSFGNPRDKVTIQDDSPKTLIIKTKNKNEDS